MLATPPDIDGGATADNLAKVQTFITSTVAPALFLVVLAGVGIALGVKWVRKGAKSA